MRAEEKVSPGQKVGGVGFECTKEGVWVGDEKDEVGWSKVLVVMGQMRVTGLPTFFTDVMSLVVSPGASSRPETGGRTPCPQG